MKGRRRQNSILLDRWHLLRFSVDDLKDDPDYCRKTLRRALEVWYEDVREDWSKLPLRKREILRLAAGSSSISPVKAAECIDGEIKLARRLLHELVEEGWLEHDAGTVRIRGYRLAKSFSKGGGRPQRGKSSSQ